MKLIPLRDGKKFKTINVLNQVVSMSPSRPMDIGEMRKRVRILDALEKAKGHLILEDADHQVLKAAIESFPWQAADSELLQIIDDVTEAKEPHALVNHEPDKPVAANGAGEAPQPAVNGAAAAEAQPTVN